VLLDRLQPYNKKRLRVCNSQPLYIESKGFTRATNAIARYHEIGFEPNDFHRGGWTARQPRNKSKPRPSKTERVCHPEVQTRLKGCATRQIHKAIRSAPSKGSEGAATRKFKIVSESAPPARPWPTRSLLSFRNFTLAGTFPHLRPFGYKVVVFDLNDDV